MTKKNNVNRGFTLAELLIVVAIIAVLVAVAIPIFSGKLKESRLAVDHANIRSAYAYIQVANITETVVIDGVEKSFSELGDNARIFYVSKDLGSLLTSATPNPSGDKYYHFKETGRDSESYVCEICQTLENLNKLGPTGFSVCHVKNGTIPVTFDNNMLYLSSY